jgi:hypothetical protein
MSTCNDILAQALGLPVEDRALLARDLLVSLESEGFDDDAEAAWAREIEARSEAVARGEFTATDWRESVERIRQELTKRRTR